MARVPVSTLDRLAVGACAVVESVGPEHAASLACEGLVPGARVDLQARAPFSGPLILGLGRARLAIARSVARAILVAPVAESDEAAE